MLYICRPSITYYYLLLPLDTSRYLLITPYTIDTYTFSGSLLLLLNNINISYYIEIPQDIIDTSGKLMLDTLSLDNLYTS